MNKLIFRPLAIVAASAITMSAHAADLNNSGFHFVLDGGITFGGDNLATASYTDGSSENVTAGGVVQIGGGVLWQSPDIPLATSLTFNYQENDASASNGSITFQRVPIEAIAYYTGVPKWRFGGGVRFVQSAKLDVNTPNDQQDIDFNNTTGGLIEVGYALSRHSWVNLRYVSEKYTVTNGGPTVDGSHVGLFLLYEF